MPESPRRRTLSLVKPEERHELGRYAAVPKARTRTELFMNRLMGDRPHPSYDVDGDGVVSATDMKIATLFDTDGDGVLDEEETERLRHMMAKEKTEAIADMLKGLNRKDPEFERIKKQVEQAGLKKDSEEMLPIEEAVVIRDAFEAVDVNKNGQIGASEVKKLGEMLENPLSDEQVATIFSEVDIDNSGEIDFGEFKRYWMVDIIGHARINM